MESEAGSSNLNGENDLFYFETDQLALKGNQDYYDVLKTLVVLTAQREKALKDFKKVSELRKEALDNPVEFLENFKNKTVEIPKICEIAKLPVIDFKKYTVEAPREELDAIYSHNSVKNNIEEIKNIKIKVSHKAWSPEEQKKLEELLYKYPPEPIEMQRFKKIAKELGNRTTQQVCSRVQKYFLKLYRAGLPIPGRIPKTSEKFRKSSLHKHQRHNHFLWKPTTFFPDLNVPVQMDESDDIPGPSTPDISQNMNNHHNNYLLSNEYHKNTNTPSNFNMKSEQEVKIDLLKIAKTQKKKEMGTNYTPFYHVGYRCDYCNEDPIVGSRWHCTTCDESIDFCTDCVISQLCSDSCHPLSHRIVVFDDDSERPSEMTDEVGRRDKQSGSFDISAYLDDANEEFKGFECGVDDNFGSEVSEYE